MSAPNITFQVRTNRQTIVGAQAARLHFQHPAAIAVMSGRQNDRRLLNVFLWERRRLACIAETEKTGFEKNVVCDSTESSQNFVNSPDNSQ